MEVNRGSISIDISKVSVQEELSLFKASMEESEKSLFSEEVPEAISNEMITEGNELLDTYQVISPAIHGGMGSVWRVYHKNWNTYLAMKRPLPKFFTEGGRKRKEAFIHECEAWIDLGLHPNIVSCYYVREIGGVPTIFSEWMDNGSLEDLIRSGELYTGSEEEVQKRLLNIAIQFARGLRYAHEKGHMIHQDVKPDNLLLSKDWEVKVSDFGLSSVASPAGGLTRAYCSPEQAAGGILTIRTDIYSWALSVMEMYLKGKPWEQKGRITGPKAGRLCREYFRMEKVPIPERLKGLLERCLRELPEERLPDFMPVTEELSDIYAEVTGEAFPLPEPEASSGTAASLNNRALSFLDLSHPAEAEASWQLALLADPGHADSLYNYALWRWRMGKIDDTEALHLIETAHEGAARERLAARLELERGNGVPVTERADEEDRLSAAVMRTLNLHSCRFPRIMKQDPLLEFSPDEDRILFGENGAILYSAVEHRETGRNMDIHLSPEMSADWNMMTEAQDGRIPEEALLRRQEPDVGENCKIVFRRDGACAGIFSLTDSEAGYRAQRKTQITVYDSAMQPVHVFSLDGWGIPPSACFTREGDLLAVSVDRQTYFFDADKGEKLPYQLEGNCLALMKAEDGRTFLLRGSFQKIQFADIQNGRCLRTIPLPGLLQIYTAEIGESLLAVCGPSGRDADLLFHMNIPQFSYRAGWELSRVHAPSEQLRLERKFRSLVFCARNACQKSEYGKALEFAEQAMELDESLRGNREAAALRREILSHGRKTALLTAVPLQTIQTQIMHTRESQLWFSEDDELLLMSGSAPGTLNLRTGEVTGGIDKAHRLPGKPGRNESTYWLTVTPGYSREVSRTLRFGKYRYEAMVEWCRNTEDDSGNDRLRLRAARIETGEGLIDLRSGKKEEWAVELAPGYHYNVELQFLSDLRTLLLRQELKDDSAGRRLCFLFFDMQEGRRIRDWTIPLEDGDFYSSMRFSPDDSLALMERQTDRRDETGFFKYTLTDFVEIEMADGTMREPLSRKPEYLHGRNYSVISNRFQYTGVGDQIIYIKDPSTIALTQPGCRKEEIEIRGDFRIPADFAISRDGTVLAVAGGEGTGEVFIYQLEWAYAFDNSEGGES